MGVARAGEDAEVPTADRVVDAAVECILEEGFYRASTNAIARRAGVTWGVIQHHFGTREALMLAIFQRAARRMDELFGSADLRAERLEDRVEALAELVWSFYRQPEFLAYVQVLLNLGQDPRTADRTLETLASLNARMAAHLPRLRGQVLDGDGPGGAEQFRFVFETLRGVAVNQQILLALPGRSSNETTAQDRDRSTLVAVLSGHLHAWRRDTGLMPAFSERREGAVAVLTWDRQAVRNALDPSTLLALSSAITAAASDPDVRACVLTGAGTVAFDAGMDLKALAAERASVGTAVAAWEAAMGAPDRVPLVAAVNGMAMGGGFEIVLRCDLVVAGEDVVFGLPEVKRKLVPGGGGLLLPRRIPLALALEIGLTGEPVPAARLHALGLVNRVVPADRVLDEAVALAAAIAEHAPETVAKIRQGMWASVAG